MIINDTTPRGEFFYWGPLLYKIKIPFEIINELLERGKKSTVDFRPNLAGILEKEFAYSLEDKKFFVQAIDPIMIGYRNVYEHWYAKSIQDKVFELTDLWINFMYPGDFNPPHIHTGSLSFIIYLSIDDILKEEYDNFRKISKKGSGPGAIQFMYGHHDPNCIVHKNFFPEVGDMYIFPSSLYHTVAPFKKNSCRISVAGNFVMIDKK